MKLKCCTFSVAGWTSVENKINDENTEYLSIYLYSEAVSPFVRRMTQTKRINTNTIVDLLQACSSLLRLVL